MRRGALVISLFTVMLLAFGSSAHAAQVSIGVVIGAPPPPRVVVAPPPPPAPAYVWVPGYWYPVKHKYRWHEGYWTLPPYEGARWIAPRHDGERYYEGYWAGERGEWKHDHRSDHDRDRDHKRFGRDRDRDRD